MSKLSVVNGYWRAKRKNRQTGKHDYFYYGKVGETSKREAMAAWLAKFAELERADLDREREGQIVPSAWLKPKTWAKALAAVKPPLTPAPSGEHRPLCFNSSPPSKWEPASLQPDVVPCRPMGQEEVQQDGPCDLSTINGAMAAFLATKRQEVKDGEKGKGGIAPKRYSNIATAVKRFVGWLGGEKPLVAINSMALQGFFQWLKSEDEANYSDSGQFVRNNMQPVNQFVRYLWESELIEMPRVLGSKSLTAQVTEPVIKLFDRDELKDLIDRADGVVKAAMLLMVNCGMTQQDVSDLHPDEVDWENGCVVRKRSKTRNKKNGNVPTVRYKLWPVTLALLNKYRSDNPDHVLVNPRTGGTLIRSVLNGENVGHTDTLAKFYNSMLKRLGIVKDCTLKNIRKTSSSLIGNNPKYARYAEYFLGESPRTITDKHYVAPSPEQFDECLDWLGQTYGFIGPSKAKRRP